MKQQKRTDKEMIKQGDVISKLKEIPDESIDCVITSPPYWGLRDYGTAKWEGGNPECDHTLLNTTTTTNNVWEKLNASTMTAITDGSITES